ncbi:MAG: hypothetical protein CR967_05945 [Proteobacteria bacterium]|nr:MAG: hypothetical protein CR967_05945 [Pseudomonadota bacterium]
MNAIANVISIISGLMTIFGITDIVSWSLTKESNQTLSQASMSIFAKSFKLAICIASFPIFLLLFREIHSIIILNFGEGWMPLSFNDPKFWWETRSWYAYLVSYFVNVLIGIPLYTITLSCIYTWSLTPFRTFWRHLRNPQQNNLKGHKLS